jgi:hypothetical protein
MFSKATWPALIIGMLILPVRVGAAGLDLIEITTNPETPGPGEEVTITLESFAVDLNTSRIVWAIDGEPMKEGIALKEFRLVAGEIGEVRVVDIVIFAPSGKIDKQIVIAPIEVDILWEAETYTPPFYKGKALASHESRIRVVAIPRFNEDQSDPTKFYYRWRMGVSQLIGEALGKESVTVPGAWSGSSQRVKLEVIDPRSKASGGGTISITSSEPQVLLYPISPVHGPDFRNAIGGQYATGDQIGVSVRAVPLYFSNTDLDRGALQYTWTIGRRESVPAKNLTTVEIPRTSSSPERRTVAVSVHNTTHVTQRASATGSINFSSSAN